jgi:hypothetical protein
MVSNIPGNLLVNLWPYIVLVIAIKIIVSVARSPWFKGKMGEFFTKTKISRLNPTLYTSFNDVTLEILGDTTQIDHIIISKFGIFVIETKNYTGWIFGDALQKTWTQIIFKTKSKFQNPLHQNQKHIHFLKSILKFDTSKFVSIVSFSPDAVFKTDFPDNVLNEDDLIPFILSHRTIKLSDKEIAYAINVITGSRLKQGSSTNRAHVQNLRQRHRRPGY